MSLIKVQADHWENLRGRPKGRIRGSCRDQGTGGRGHPRVGEITRGPTTGGILVLAAMLVKAGIEHVQRVYIGFKHVVAFIAQHTDLFSPPRMLLDEILKSRYPAQ